MTRTYTVAFKTMDGNYHKESVRALSADHARKVFWSNERGKLRWSRISQITSIR